MLDERAGSAGMPDADLPTESGSTASGPLVRASFLVGAAGLLSATATDALAVLGRHAGFSILGSIEIVQCAIVLASSAAIIGATLHGAHASVHIFTERMRPETAARAARVAAFLGAILFVGMAVGSAWVARDLWSGYERTELLGIPLRWLRLIWIGTTITVASLFLRNALGARK